MDDLNDKITGGTLSATEWNQVPSELQNVIEALGQTLSAGDLNQLGKGIAGYVANGQYYTDSGSANAYVLSNIGTIQSPPDYTDGMQVVFKPGNTNTGASTVNVETIGIKNIYLDGAALTGGELVANEEITLEYNVTGDRFNIVKRTLMIQDWVDGGGAADDKRIRFIVDGGVAVFKSLTDALANRQTILTMDLGTADIVAGNDFDVTGVISAGSGAITNELTVGDYLNVGSPTGGDKGPGTLNVDSGIYKDGFFVPYMTTGSFSTGSVSAGALYDTTFAHGLPTDDVHILFSAVTTTGRASYSIAWRTVNDVVALQSGAPDTTTNTHYPAAPTSGNIGVRLKNEYVTALTFTIYWIAIARTN